MALLLNSLVKDNNSIYDILGKMEVLLELFKEEPKFNHLIPFLKTYFMVTREVSKSYLSRDSEFTDLEVLEKLDIVFANKYFSPLSHQIDLGTSLSPWKNYFQYCKCNEDNPFLQMLLGIFVHINADLSTTLYELKYSNREDFLKINEMLESLTPSLMRYLAFEERDLVGLGGTIFTGYFSHEVREIIVKWRDDAWNNSLLLSNGDLEIQDLHSEVESKVQKLIEIWKENFRFNKVLKLVKLIEHI